MPKESRGHQEVAYKTYSRKMSGVPDPDVKEGIQYWKSQPVNLDGVLGGFGSGSLPRVDSLGSRQFLLRLCPELCAVPSALRSLSSAPLSEQKRTRALDVGAGIGRVTSDVLLHLFSDVMLLEPVENFVNEAWLNAKAGAIASPSDEDNRSSGWRKIAQQNKSVTACQGILQDFDPCRPRHTSKFIGRVGHIPSIDDTESGFDVIWCQWCLGHLSDNDLVDFLLRSIKALRGDNSLIVVKENVCSESDDEPRTVFDAEDSSLTRSNAAFKKIFQDAGLHLIQEQTQQGFPAGLYPVKLYALKPYTGIRGLSHG